MPTSPRLQPYVVLEGIVSKRRDARYSSGRSLAWLKIKDLAYERRSDLG